MVCGWFSLFVCLIAALGVQVAARPECYYMKTACPLECTQTNTWYCAQTPPTSAVCPCPKGGVAKSKVAPAQKPSFLSALLQLPNLCADLLSAEINIKPPGKTS